MAPLSGGRFGSICKAPGRKLGNGLIFLNQC